LSISPVQLGFELRLVIRRRQLLTDVEVVLGVLADEVAGHGDRRHVVQCGVQPPGQFDDGASALNMGDVGGPLLSLAGGDGRAVIDRRAVHHVVDLAQLGDGLVGELEFRQVFDQRFYSFVPVQGPSFEPPQRLAADQHPHLRIRLGVQ
jgi:hypothetical protein